VLADIAAPPVEPEELADPAAPLEELDAPAPPGRACRSPSSTRRDANWNCDSENVMVAEVTIPDGPPAGPSELVHFNVHCKCIIQTHLDVGI